jgi:regulator of cell morphogenesis and NO signaling
MQAIESKSIGELASSMPHAIAIFEKLGIDYCCGGQASLEEACARVGVPVNDVVSQLQAPRSSTETQGVDWTARSATELTNHILEVFHESLKSELPALAQLIEKVCSVHGGNHADLFRLKKLYFDLKNELEPHMMKEEQILFPAILTMDENAGRHDGGCFGTIENPIRVMLMEHDTAGEVLRQMRQISADYAVPADACTSYRALFTRLEQLERDLHQHIHLENNILFPRAIQLEARN